MVIWLVLISFPECEKSTQKYEIYQKCEQKLIFIEKIILKAVVVDLVSVLIFTGLLPISYVIIGYPSPEKWIMPLAFVQLVDIFLWKRISNARSIYWIIFIFYSFLFDRTTLFGFYFAWLIQYFMPFFYFFNLVLLAMIHISMCIYITAMVNDSRSTFKKLNGNIESKKQTDYKSHSRKTETRLAYVEAINFHIKVFE